jgi:hypothetical protein
VNMATRFRTLQCSVVVVALAVAPVHARANLAPEPEPTEEPEPPEELEPIPVEAAPIEPIPIEPPSTEAPAIEPTEPTEQPDLDEPLDSFDPYPLAFREPTPEERARGRTMRRTGLGLMAAGGAVGVIGLGLTIAFTIVGDRREAVADPVLTEIERADKVAQVGGVALASGLVVAAAGGIVFSLGNRELQPRPVARLCVSPAIGGVVVSGQF